MKNTTEQAKLLEEKLQQINGIVQEMNEIGDIALYCNLSFETGVKTDNGVENRVMSLLIGDSMDIANSLYHDDNYHEMQQCILAYKLAEMTVNEMNETEETK